MNKVVAIILVNFNNWEDTIECLESIFSNNYNHFVTILIDNNSTNNSIEHIINWAEGKLNVWNSISNSLKRLSFPPIAKPVNYKLLKGEILDNYKITNESLLNSNLLYIIEASINKGFAFGNNVGIRFLQKYLDFDYVWLLNNDTVIEKDTLSFLVKKSKEYEQNSSKIGILGSLLLNYCNPRLIQAFGGKYNIFLARGTQNYNHELYENIDFIDENCDYVIGASMFVRKDFIVDIGLMCEDYFLYFEELDWLIRGGKKGWNIGHEIRSKVYHKEGNTTSKKENSFSVDLIQIRSRILFTLKFYPYALITVYPMIIVSIFRRINRRQFSKILPILKIMINPKKSVL